MKLKKIKLAGFKSFVDPTVIDLSQPLVAIVGPNGCGKSNIIDAIRWVMGESSASRLRGESSTDVIFNGSSARKPVGQASVELQFDNSDGSLGGEYASFGEISIRRQITRDNQSIYFLNGVRCRRKDITDIFLGTGLGPRSYAIIEQGMIARVIEAKPEEMRSFVEEAAGISVYRKRRQETETRMRHTRENLARLEDVRQELDKQLERLKRQSESALKYQEYKQIAVVLETEVATLRWKNLSQDIIVRREEIQKLSLNFDEKMANRAHVDLELEKLRSHLEQETESFNTIQAEYYDVGSHIARTEQTLEHHKKREKELKEEIFSNNENLKNIQKQTEQDKEHQAELQTKLELLTPSLTESEQKANHTSELLEEAQEKMREWNEKFEAFQQDASLSERSSEVEKARIEQFEKQSKEVLLQLQKLQQESKEWDLEKLKNALNLLESQMVSKESETHNNRSIFNTISQELNDTQKTLEALILNFDNIKLEQQQTKGQWVSLQALQKVALGKEQEALKLWIEGLGLEKNECKRLGETLEVMPGYEKAFETVLGFVLQALCVSTLDQMTPHLKTLTEGSLTLIESTHVDLQAHNIPNPNLPLDLLRSKIKSQYPIHSFLQGVYLADDLQQALPLRAQLKSNESIITKDGTWLGKHWIRVQRGAEHTDSILQREQDIKNLETVLATLEEKLLSLTGQIEKTKDNIKTLEAKREACYKTEQTESNELKELSGKISAAKASLEHGRQRVLRIQEDTESAQQKQRQLQQDIGIARLALQKALDEMQDFSIRRQRLLEEKGKLKNILHQLSEDNRVNSDHFHQISINYETLKTQLHAVAQGIKRSESHCEQAMKQNSKLQEAIAECQSPQAELKSTLESLLSNRIHVETRLNDAKQKLEQAQQQSRNLEKQRNELEQEANSLREKTEHLKIECQGFEVRAQTYQEKLDEHQLTVEMVMQTLDKDADETVWTQKLEEVTRKIERLGAINLAAIEEFQVESERKNYLDAQHKDLSSALESLENAIKKIDRESRSKFKDTFDRINQEFQTLFPKLFGGGQAYLELQGEDLLKAGVTIMARPPGKRNSTIHLLSGGEKALTAVSLVFSIFRLNPAPFCLLDEVDAPLDDANVHRFCQLVKHMAESLQFIYVTHNKISMEMAHHLMGVTMKEPGVSRLVTVDVAKAHEMATA